MSTQLRVAVLALLTWACGDKPAPAPLAQPEPAKAPLAVAAAAPVPPNAGPTTLRCGDLMTPEDLDAAGADPSQYDPDKTAAPGLGVNCVVGALSVTLFEGSQYTALIDGFKTMGGQSGLGASEGPSVGSERQWTVMGPIHGLMFLSSNRRYAANLSGADKSQLEKLARGIDARMSRR